MMNTETVTARVIGTQADIADAVMTALNYGYVANDLQASFKEDMAKHATECKCRYRNGYVIEMRLGQATACGMQWGIKR